ncbi:MAG: ATP-binding protein [Firmicutes bacterium]|nr:ATP-binding protein [Bacillota bacterium]
MKKDKKDNIKKITSLLLCGMLLLSSKGNTAKAGRGGRDPISLASYGVNNDGNFIEAMPADLKEQALNCANMPIVEKGHFRFYSEEDVNELRVTEDAMTSATENIVNGLVAYENKFKTFAETRASDGSVVCQGLLLNEVLSLVRVIGTKIDDMSSKRRKLEENLLNSEKSWLDRFKYSAKLPHLREFQDMIKDGLKYLGQLDLRCKDIEGKVRDEANKLEKAIAERNAQAAGENNRRSAEEMERAREEEIKAIKKARVNEFSKLKSGHIKHISDLLKAFNSLLQSLPKEVRVSYQESISSTRDQLVAVRTAIENTPYPESLEELDPDAHEAHANQLEVIDNAFYEQRQIADNIHSEFVAEVETGRDLVILESCTNQKIIMEENISKRIEEIKTRENSLPTSMGDEDMNNTISKIKNSLKEFNEISDSLREVDVKFKAKNINLKEIAAILQKIQKLYALHSRKWESVERTIDLILKKHEAKRAEEQARIDNNNDAAILRNLSIAHGSKPLTAQNLEEKAKAIGDRFVGLYEPMKNMLRLYLSIKEGKLSYDVHGCTLLAGPSGCGKSVGARAFAAVTDHKVVHLTKEVLTDPEAAKAFFAVLAAYKREKAPVAAIIDELDAYAAKRLGSSSLAANLLGIMDHIKENYPDVFLIFTTNCPGALDEALLRRLSVVIHFKNPTLDEMVILLSRLFAQYKIDRKYANSEEFAKSIAKNFYVNDKIMSPAMAKLVISNVVRKQMFEKSLSRESEVILTDEAVKTECSTYGLN